MKNGFLSVSKIISAVLCISILMSSMVFAAENKDTTLDIQSLDYQTAVDMAIKNASSLKKIADQIDVTLDNKEDLFDGGVRPGDSTQLVVVSAQRLAYLSNIYSLDASYRISKITEDVTKIGIQAAVKNSFTTILLNQSKLDLLQKNYNLQKQLLAQANVKNQVGVMSNKDLEDLNRQTQQMAEQIKQLQMNIDNAYIALNDLIGTNPEDRYEIVNEVEYTPLEMTMSLEMYINRKLSTDQSLQMQQIGVENAEFAAKTISLGTTGSQYRTTELEATNAARDYKNAKEDKEKSIREAYIQLQQLESVRKNLQTDLEKAKSDLEKAEVNFKVGNITKLTLDQATLALESIENSFLENTLNHDLLMFTFDNTCVLGSIS
ncbi:MAG: TolC family protein [Firmicutes bacterium]|jgi:outer membrane protein TolC|nr:TolC family protein [Bacillota bacterium]